MLCAVAFFVFVPLHCYSIIIIIIIIINELDQNLYRKINIYLLRLEMILYPFSTVNNLAYIRRFKSYSSVNTLLCYKNHSVLHREIVALCVEAHIKHVNSFYK
jgi:hypothetical protein